MGSSGMWVVTALEPGDVARLADAFEDAVAAHRDDPEIVRRWRAWAGHPELVTGYRPEWPGSNSRILDEPSLSFLNLDGYPVAEAGLAGDCWNSAVNPPPPAVAITRKVDPVGALFYGLGPKLAARLPGWWGNFLLDPAECSARLADAEEILSERAAHRAEAVERARFWLAEVGDAPDCDPAQVMDDVLECWRAAASLGLGICGTTDSQ